MPNNRESKYVRQKLIKFQGEIDESTIIVGDLNTPLLDMDRPGPGGRKLVRTYLNSATPSITWIKLTSVDDFIK